MIPENEDPLPTPKADKPQLIQHTRKLKRVKFKGVIRCFAVGELANQEKFVAVGSQDNCLSILNSNFEITYQKTFSRWVRCVAIGDIDHDGQVEIIAGLGDKTVRLLKHMDKATEEEEAKEAWEEIGQFQCTGFVSSVSIANVTGSLEDPDFQNEVVVGSWDNKVRLMRFTDGECEQIWHRTFEDKIQTIRVRDLTRSGQNEVIVAQKDGGLTVLHGFDGNTLWEVPDVKSILAMDVGLQDRLGNPVILIGGNEKQLSIFNNQGDLIHQISVEDRITALKIQDIDGSTVPDVVLGLGDKHLAVLSLENPFVESLRPKWEQRIHGVVNAIDVADINQDSKVEIIYGGYTQTLQALQDNYYGITALFEWPSGSPSVTPDMVGIETNPAQPTPALADGVMSSSNADQALFCASDETARSLGAVEPDSKSTPDHRDIYHPSDLSQTSIPSPAATATTASGSDGEPQAGNEEKTSDSSTTDDFRITDESKSPTGPQFVMHIFENVEFYPTKASLLAAFVSGGLTSKQSLKMFAELKEMNYVRYQRAAPRGYYLRSEGDSQTPSVPSKPKVLVPPKTHVKEPTRSLESAQRILEQNPYFSSKALLINAMREGDIPEKEILPSIEYFKTKSLLTYSRKTPRGYHYLPDQPSVSPTISVSSKIPLSPTTSVTEETNSGLRVSPLKESAPTKTKIKAPPKPSAVSAELSTLLTELFDQTPLLASKGAYLSALGTQFQTATDLSPEKLFLLFKTHGLVQYSRGGAQPRGYSLVK